MTKADLHHLVDSLPDEAVDGAALLLQRVLLRQVDPAQAWVWTDDWQDQLRSSLADPPDLGPQAGTSRMTAIVSRICAATMAPTFPRTDPTRTVETARRC